MGFKHPGLFRSSLKINSHNIHWIKEDERIKENQEKKFMVRIRHRQQPQSALLIMKKTCLYITFNKPQRGIAKGQFAASYNQGELLGSGVIS